MITSWQTLTVIDRVNSQQWLVDNREQCLAADTVDGQYELAHLHYLAVYPMFILSAGFLRPEFRPFNRADTLTNLFL